MEASFVFVKYSIEALYLIDIMLRKMETSKVNIPLTKHFLMNRKKRQR